MTEHHEYTGDSFEMNNPPCQSCRRYCGYARCATYPRQIPIEYLIGNAECAKYFKLDET